MSLSYCPMVGWWECRWIYGIDGWLTPRLWWVTPITHFVMGGNSLPNAGMP